MKKLAIFLTAIVCMASVILLAQSHVSAQLDILIPGDDGSANVINLVPPVAEPFNNNTGSVNFSEFAEIWITNEGDMDNVPDLYASFIGVGFNDTINIHDQDLNKTSNVTFDSINVTRSIIIGNGTDFTHELDVHGHVEFEHMADFDGDHGVEIDTDAAGFGDVKALFIDYDTGAIVAEQDEEVIFLNIDQFEALGGAVTGLLIVSTEGLANVTGLQVGVEINPIFQLSGIFENMDSALNNSNNVLTAFTTAGDDIDIFVEDDDTVTIGNDVRFSQMEWILNRSAGGAGIKPQFWHSTGVNTWSLFAPADGTSGLRDSGVIIWELSDIFDWEVGLNSEFLIRINRTQNNIPTTPIESFVQIAVAEEFFWDKDGDLSINSLTVVQDIDIADDTDLAATIPISLEGSVDATTIVWDFDIANTWNANQTYTDSINVTEQIEAGGVNLYRSNNLTIHDLGEIVFNQGGGSFVSIIRHTVSTLIFESSTIVLAGQVLRLGDGTEPLVRLNFDTSGTDGQIDYQSSDQVYAFGASGFGSVSFLTYFYIEAFNKNINRTSDISGNILETTADYTSTIDDYIINADNVSVNTELLNISGNFNVNGNMTSNAKCGTHFQVVVNEAGAHAVGQIWRIGNSIARDGRSMVCDGIIDGMIVSWDADPTTDTEVVTLRIDNSAQADCNVTVLSTEGNFGNRETVAGCSGITFTSLQQMTVSTTELAGGTSLTDGIAIIYGRNTF